MTWWAWILLGFAIGWLYLIAYTLCAMAARADREMREGR